MWRLSQSVLVLLAIVVATLTPLQALAYTEFDNPSEALHFLPPLESGATTGGLDESLTDFLTITIYQKTGGGLDLVDEFTSQNKGSERLRLEDGSYLVNWHTSVPSTGGEFQIVTSIAGMQIGSLNVILTKGHMKDQDTLTDGTVTLSTRGGIPIKLTVDNHPAIRARTLTEQSYSASDIAEVLLDEFGLTAEESVQLLYNENHDATSVGLALINIYGLDPEMSSAILKAVGYLAEEIGELLVEGLGWTAEQAASLLKTIGFPVVEIGGWLVDAWGWTAEQAASLLETIGFLVEEIVGWLYDVENWTKQQVASLLRTTLGYGWNAVASILESVFGDDGTAVVNILYDIGADFSAAWDVLEIVFNWGYFAIMDFLSTLFG